MNLTCIHGTPMEVKCGLCAGEGFGDEAKQWQGDAQVKPITASDCYSTTPVQLCQCARCVAFVQSHHKGYYVGKSHNDLAKERGAAAGICTNAPEPIPLTVADILQQHLCDELANLSRNVAGLTGVAKQLAEAQTARERANDQPNPSDEDWYWYSGACVDFINQIQERMGNTHQEFLTCAVQQFLKQLGLKVNKRPYA